MHWCVLEEKEHQCARQIDQAAIIDLRQDEELLWKNLRDKGRNLVRAGRRKGVTTRISNDVVHFDDRNRLRRKPRQQRQQRQRYWRDATAAVIIFFDFSSPVGDLSVAVSSMISSTDLVTCGVNSDIIVCRKPSAHSFHRFFS